MTVIFEILLESSATQWYQFFFYFIATSIVYDSIKLGVKKQQNDTWLAQKNPMLQFRYLLRVHTFELLQLTFNVSGLDWKISTIYPPIFGHSSILRLGQDRSTFTSVWNLLRIDNTEVFLTSVILEQANISNDISWAKGWRWEDMS